MSRITEGTEGLEKGLRRHVIEQLKIRGCVAWSIETETVAGFPDIVAVLPCGKFLAIETKKKGGTTSKIQQETLDQVRKNNGIGKVVASRQQARALFLALGLLPHSGGEKKRLKQAEPPRTDSSSSE